MSQYFEKAATTATTSGAQGPEKPKILKPKSGDDGMAWRDRFLVSGYLWVFESLRLPRFCLTLVFSGVVKSAATFSPEKYFCFAVSGPHVLGQSPWLQLSHLLILVLKFSPLGLSTYP